MILYEFRDSLHMATDTEPVVIKGSRAEIERFIPLAEFGPLFGGYVLWRAPDAPTEAMPDQALGVWGSRTVSKFRRILRERGAEIQRVFDRGPAQRLHTITQDYRDYRTSTLA
jgi:hypothetical protein